MATKPSGTKACVHPASSPREPAADGCARELGRGAMLEIDPGTVCYIVLKARQVYAPEDTVEENIGANPVDEEALEALAGNEDDPSLQELKAWIESLNLDEQCQLVALAWLGRGDYGKEDWPEAVVTAQ